MAAACKRRRTALAPTSSNTSTGSGSPLTGTGPRGSDPHQPFDQGEGAGGQPDAPRGGELLHTRRQMRRLPDRRVVHMQVVANRPHHHLAGVEADAQAQLQAAAAAHRLSGGLHGRLHGQGGIAGAQGVVFVGNGGAKQGHNAVAEHLVHRALEAVHGLHHQVDGGIEELLRGFGVEATDEFRRVFDVRKQHGHLLAFAFQRLAAGADLVAEMGWRVGQRGLLQHMSSGSRGGQSRCWCPSPDQHVTVLVQRQFFGMDEVLFKVFEQVIIDPKAPLEHPIR